MKKNVVGTLIFSAIMIAACSPIPATGGTGTLPELTSEDLQDPYSYPPVAPIDGSSINPGIVDEELPPTGGSPALVSSGRDLSLSDEALVIQGLSDGESNVKLFLFLPSGRDKTLSDEALELEGS